MGKVAVPRWRPIGAREPPLRARSVRARAPRRRRGVLVSASTMLPMGPTLNQSLAEPFARTATAQAGRAASGRPSRRSRCGIGACVETDCRPGGVERARRAHEAAGRTRQGLMVRATARGPPARTLPVRGAELVDCKPIAGNRSRISPILLGPALACPRVLAELLWRNYPLDGAGGGGGRVAHTRGSTSPTTPSALGLARNTGKLFVCLAWPLTRRSQRWWAVSLFGQFARCMGVA